MFCCASSVLPPMCGVRITLSNSRSGETNSSPAPLGSDGNTSIAAPAKMLRPQRLRQGLDLHHSPSRRVDQQRTCLHAGDLWRARSSAASAESREHAASPRRPSPAMRPATASRAHSPAPAWFRCRKTPPAFPALPPAARSACRCARTPSPPGTCPRASREPSAVFTQAPRCAAALRSGIPRISMMISASTSSATLRVFENGALKTGMPRSCAASRSTWLVPMQKHPMPVSRGAFSITRAVNFVAERIPIKYASRTASIRSASASDLG